MNSPAQPDTTPWTYTQIISVVTVVDALQADPVAALVALHDSVMQLGAPCEIVVVLSGCPPERVAALRTLATQRPDLQFYNLQYAVDHSTALLAGLESAVGDWVATLALGSDRPAGVGALFAAVIKEGAEVGLPIGVATGPPRSLGWRLGSRLFHRLFLSIHGFSLARATPTLRLLSRTVVNAILQHDSPLVAFETLVVTAGYRQAHVTYDGLRRVDVSLLERVRTRWRTLIGINAVPLRLANALCGLGALLATFYSLYVVTVYFFKPDVMPGWTTVSLMLSCMFLMVSLVLGLLSEYMIMLLDGGSRRPRYQTAEEFASTAQSRRRYLNVEIDA